MTIVLAVIMVVFAPMTWSYMYHDKQAEALIFNEMSTFIDRVTDKGSVNEEDMNQLYLDVNSHGIVVDVDVQRLIRVASPQDDGTTKSVYFSANDLTETNPGDTIKVHVTEIGVSKGDVFLYAIVGVNEAPVDLTIAGVVG